MTPSTFGPAVTPHLVRPVTDASETTLHKPLLRLYVGPRFFMGAVPPPLKAWAGIPKSIGEPPVIAALQQWRKGAMERLAWFDWEPAETGSRSLLVVSDPAPESPQQIPPRKLQLPSWTTPSTELTFKMLNVPHERWSEILGPDDDPTEVLTKLTKELRIELLATIADIAFSAREQQQERIALSVERRFTPEFVRDLFRTLPIDPYMAREALEGLHDELLAQIRREPLCGSWGVLVESEGGLVIHLRPAKAASEDAASTVQPAY
jgi:hypothetical protein